MADFHLAQINVAQLVEDITHPQIAEFVAELKPINLLADQSPGFIWRLQSNSGDATNIPYDADPRTIVNMSVWTTPEALRNFTYRSRHVEIFRKRAGWFHKHTQAPYCLWWIPAGHRPVITEGRDRLNHYRQHGPTPESFWFSHLFPAPTLTLA